MAVVVLIAVLVAVDLLAHWFGCDSRPGVAASPERWIGRRPEV
jgi:hypothetical protein